MLRTRIVLPGGRWCTQRLRGAYFTPHRIPRSVSSHWSRNSDQFKWTPTLPSYYRYFRSRGFSSLSLGGSYGPICADRSRAVEPCTQRCASAGRTYWRQTAKFRQVRAAINDDESTLTTSWGQRIVSKSPILAGTIRCSGALRFWHPTLSHRRSHFCNSPSPVQSLCPGSSGTTKKPHHLHAPTRSCRNSPWPWTFPCLRTQRMAAQIYPILEFRTKLSSSSPPPSPKPPVWKASSIKSQ